LLEWIEFCRRRGCKPLLCTLNVPIRRRVCSGSLVTLNPANVASPEVGGNSAVSIPIVVVLPAPVINKESCPVSRGPRTSRPRLFCGTALTVDPEQSKALARRNTERHVIHGYLVRWEHLCQLVKDNKVAIRLTSQDAILLRNDVFVVKERRRYWSAGRCTASTTTTARDETNKTSPNQNCSRIGMPEFLGRSDMSTRASCMHTKHSLLTTHHLSI